MECHTSFKTSLPSDSRAVRMPALTTRTMVATMMEQTEEVQVLAVDLREATKEAEWAASARHALKIITTVMGFILVCLTRPTS